MSSVIRLIEESFNEADKSWSIQVHGLGETCHVVFEDPFTSEDYSRIKWYVEEYAQRDPHSEPRASLGRRKLSDYGASLAAILEPLILARSSQDCREVIQIRIIDRDDGSRFHAILWELLEEPHSWKEIHAKVIVSRSIGGLQPVPAPLRAGRSFNILFVSARPALGEDRPYLLVSRPVVKLLENEQSGTPIDFKFVTPATWENFEICLSEKVYDLVHFDMHGRIGKDGPELGFTRIGRKKAKWVGADEVAKKLHAAGVQRVVLNACDTAKISPTSSTSLSYRFVKKGIREVVGMSCAITEDIAFLFVTNFYRDLLIRGRPVPFAVANSRAVLRQNAKRSARFSLKIEVCDFFVPVLYEFDDEIPTTNLSSSIYSSERATPGDFSSTRLSESRAISNYEADTDLERVPVGRDEDILLLEEAFTKNKLVRLTGSCGSGKTQLAMFIGDWWVDTDFIEFPVYIDCYGTSNLARKLLSTYQLICRNHAQSSLPQEEQADYIHKTRCLIVLDNFNVALLNPSRKGGLTWDEVDEDLQRIFRRFEEPTSRCRLLVNCTSNTTVSASHWPSNSPFAHHNLESLSLYKATNLGRNFIGSIGSAFQLSLADGHHFEHLIDFLEHNPLSLRMILAPLAIDHKISAMLEVLQLSLPSALADSISRWSKDSKDVLSKGPSMPFLNLEEARVIPSSLERFFQIVNVLKSQPLIFQALVSFSPVQKRLIRFQRTSSTDLRHAEAERIVVEMLETIGLLSEDAELARVRIQAYEMHPMLPYLIRFALRNHNQADFERRMNAHEKRFCDFYERLLAPSAMASMLPEVQSLVVQKDIENILNAITIASNRQNIGRAVNPCLEAIVRRFDLTNILSKAQYSRLVYVLNDYSERLEQKMPPSALTQTSPEVSEEVFEQLLRVLVFLIHAPSTFDMTLEVAADMLQRARAMVAFGKAHFSAACCTAVFELCLQCQQILFRPSLDLSDLSQLQEVLMSEPPASRSAWDDVFIVSKLDVMDRIIRSVQEGLIEFNDLEAYISRLRTQLSSLVAGDSQRMELIEMRMSRWQAARDRSAWLEISRSQISDFMKPKSRNWILSGLQKAHFQRPALEQLSTSDLPLLYSILEINIEEHDRWGEIHTRELIFYLEIQNGNYQSALDHHTNLRRLEGSEGRDILRPEIADLVAGRCRSLAKILQDQVEENPRPIIQEANVATNETLIRYELARKWLLEAREFFRQAPNCKEELFDTDLALVANERDAGHREMAMAYLAIAMKDDPQEDRQQPGDFLCRLGELWIHLTGHLSDSPDPRNDEKLKLFLPYISSGLRWDANNLHQFLGYCCDWLLWKGRDWPSRIDQCSPELLNFFGRAQEFLVKLEPSFSQYFLSRFIPKGTSERELKDYVEKLLDFGNGLLECQAGEVQDLCLALLISTNLA